ncbi:glycosyl hydrolase [Sphaerosporella brunnea]|uniref:Arabinan endo-1,5-alpha-L-arabinosidase n=1 Tax=Sphaerosporella brunnea TaxID=1250544 RepID=A0A5J5EN84_9PEZI|nr:glycosyl hydrolase [Sphaerosporella brunnea]
MRAYNILWLSAALFAAPWPFAIAFAAPASNSDPFSPSKWPMPNKVYGEDDGWGTVHVHDPSVVKRGRYYYSFSTHLGIAIARAPTLNGPWKHLGSVIPTASIIDLPGRDDLWAPDVSFHDGVYYCYYSVSTFGSQNSAIGLATSKTLLPGSWTDHGEVMRSYDPSDFPDAPSPNNITNAIDPNLYIDPGTQKAVLSYGSFWSDIWQFPLKHLLFAVESSPPPSHLALDPTPPQAVEGAFLHKSEDWYYLYFSAGICCGYNVTMPAKGKEYKIKVGRGQTAQGPFFDRNGTNLVDGGGDIVFGSHDWVYGPGGQGVLVDGNREILYYHYVDTRVGYGDAEKFLGWNEIHYLDGWPVLE